MTRKYVEQKKGKSKRNPEINKRKRVDECMKIEKN